MALAETANLIVNLGLKGNFTRDIGKANRSLDQLVKGESRAFKAGAQIGTGIRNAGRIAAVGIAAIASQVALGLDSLIDLEKQTAQTNAVLKSTKGVAGITAEAVGKMAEEFEGLNATIGDEFVRSAENMLLTFTRVRGKAFKPTLAAILDLNTALGRDENGLTQTALQVGKALNDPTKGLLALRRAGVQFTDAQVKKIKSLQKEGKLYEAQKIILAELNKEFGGSFAAQGKTTAGRIAKFKDSIDDLQRALAKALLPTLGNVADALSKTLADPKVIAGVEDFGKQLAGLFSPENLATGAKVIGDFIQAAKDAAPVVASAAKTIGTVIGTAVRLFQSLPPELQSLAIGGLAVNKLTGGLVTNIAGGLISSVLKQLVSGVVNVQGGVVNVTGAGGVGAAGGGGNKLLALGVAGAIIAAAVPIGEAFAAALPDSWKGGGDHPGESESQRRIREGREAMDRNGTVPVRVVNDRAHEGGAQRLSNQELSRRWRIGRSQRDTLRAEHIKGGAVGDLGKVGPKLDKVSTAVGLARDASKEAGVETKTAITQSAAVTGALIGAGTATTQVQGSLTQGAVRGVAPPIVGAIRANRPIVSTSVVVNVSGNSVTKAITVQSRLGPGTGSNAAPNTRSGPQPI